MKAKARSFFILSSTLLVGMLLGALVHAHFFDNRVKRVHRISTQDGFVASYVETIQPSSPEQETALREVLAVSATQVHEAFQSSRDQVRARIDAMYEQLEPMLSAEQVERLQERRDRRRKD